MSDQDTNAPWRNEEVLRQKYWDENKSLGDIADDLNCSRQTVSNWMDRFGIEKDKPLGYGEREYRDKELLQQLYHSEGLSTIEMAERLDCSKQTILKYMEKYGIERQMSYRDKVGCFFTNKGGYEHFAVTQDYETTNINIHRLLAVAIGKLPPEEFVGRELNVHHKNGIPWDNRPENLQVLKHGEHAKVHSEERKRDEGRFD